MEEKMKEQILYSFLFITGELQKKGVSVSINKDTMKVIINHQNIDVQTLSIKDAIKKINEILSN